MGSAYTSCTQGMHGNGVYVFTLTHHTIFTFVFRATTLEA